MGTWGAGINSSDTAQDLKDEYYAAFSYYDVPTALAKLDEYVRKDFDESDEIEWCAYYYSLADFMWKKGILTNEVRAKAVEMVESDYGIQEWIDAGKAALRERRKELDKFVKRITSPQCAPKKIKTSFRPDDVFIDGEVIAIELRTDDKKYIKSNDNSPEISDEEFLAYNKKFILIHKVYSDISYRSFVVPELYDRSVYFRLFEGIYDSIEDIDINSLQAIPVLEIGDNIHLSFRLDNSMAKFKKRNYKMLGTKKLPKIGEYEHTLFFSPRYFDFNSNYAHYNFDSDILDVLVDKKFVVSERHENSDCSEVKRVINLVVDRELGSGFSLSRDEYKKLNQKKKSLIEERINDIDKMISFGAKLYELRFGKILLGIAVKTQKEPAVIYMRSDDDEHRKMLQEFVDNV